MADTVPVCDVLCEAMEYLSKLGSNLRVRSDNLKEKKIRKDRLKNTHAVQKAANKVLLICELSKKSLENVESGVKNLLTQIDISQSSSGGKNRRRSTRSNITYEYFDYESTRLRIREKVSLEQYTSAKVVAKPLPPATLKKYPVYHDCILYRELRDDSKLHVERERVCDGDSSLEKLVNKIILNYKNTIENKKHEISEKDDVSKGHQSAGESSDNNVNDSTQNTENSSNIDTVTNKSTLNNVGCVNNATEKISKNIEIIKDACNVNEVRSNELDSESMSEKRFKKILPLRDSSEDKDEDTQPIRNSLENVCQDEISQTSTASNDVNLPAIDGKSVENVKENSKDIDKDDASSECSETKRSFIKCININKLLKAPSQEPDETNTSESAKKPPIVLKIKDLQREALSHKKDKSKKRRDRLSSGRKKSDTSDENYWEEKRKRVKLFKPKQFSIKIYRLPDFSAKFLEDQGLNKITRDGSIVFELNNSMNSCMENVTTEKNAEELDLQDSSQSIKDKTIEKPIEPINNTSGIGLLKDSLLNDSDSDKSLNRKTDKDLLDVAESVRNALLNDSDSDRNSGFEGNISSCLVPSEKDSDLTKSKANEDCAADSLNGNSEAVKAALLNDSDNGTCLPNEMANVTESLANNDERNEPIQTQDAVKSSLLDDSSDNSVSNDKKQKEREENTQVPEDSNKVKSMLLNDSSDNTANIPLKRRRESEKISPKKSKRKHIRESMHAKKMLLTYSSSSDTEDEQLRNTLKEIKETLLEEIIADRGKSCITMKPGNNSNSDSEKHTIPILRIKLRKPTKAASSASDSEPLKKSLRIKKKIKRRSRNSPSEDNENINSSVSKMGRSRAKAGSSSGQNSDSQDANDKDIYGLTNLRALIKPRRRRSSTEHSEGTCYSRPSQELDMPKAPRIKEEGLLKAETSSDAASLAASEGEEVEELPTVSKSTMNGDGISHLAKDDLLGDSDSSSSQNDKSQEGSKKSDSDEDKLKSRRRPKGPAISSDSEEGSSRRPNRGRRVSDFEDSEDDGSSEAAVKKKRKKRNSESDGNSSADSGKKKRRRIKNVDDSDGSDSDTENEGRNKHGRKNIRKVMGKNQLEEATKKAAREEKERIARIAERQKVYNNLQFDESGKPDEVVLEKVVLDFDPETKEPLIEVDRGLVRKLKPHQANGIKFMWDACFESAKRIKKDKGSGCILAHCMGLGKTLQVVSLTHTLLTHGDLTSVKRVLVVCPLSTVLNWVNEFRIWLKHAERDYEVDVYELSRFKQNSERAFQLQQWFEHGGVCVLGYEMFRNLSADNNKKFKKKMLKNFQESLVDPGPDLVVCDEGHLLKNEKTSLSQSMNRVKTLRRIVLTGTPLQNNLKEYYCMVQFVKPNLLGKYNEYLNRFVNPITNGQYTDSTEHDIKVMKRRSHVLHKMLDGAVQRRDYGVLAPFLPPKHEYVLFITLTEVQIKLYQHYLDNYSRRPLPGKSSGFLFPDFQSLQRIWTHPLVLKYNSERYEIMQQKKREREEEDSEGSLVDFIDDDSTPDESSTEESSDDFSDVSDDSRKKSKKKKAGKKGKAKDSKVTTRRGTRANPVEQLEEEEKPLEALETKYENPTEWWIKLMNDDELDDMRNSHKLVLLFDILRQCEAIGDKLLVFSQSLYSLDLIEHFLGKVDEATQEGRIDEKLGGHVGSWSPGIDYFRLDGSTSCENRSIWCKNFNREDNPRARLFLISTRAGGLGINLVAANRVVIFDVSWNPSHDVQSIFRVYRFGQKKPCYIYRFLAMGTMEEKIYERQVTKQAISKRVIDEQQIDRHYAENDLAELYKFEPRPPAPRPLPPLPKDRLFAEMLREHDAQIYKYHEHDSLLENKEEETLSEEERKAAWEDFENEKNRPPPAPFPTAWPMANGLGLMAHQQQLAYATIGAMIRKDMPNMTEAQLRDFIPLFCASNPSLMQNMTEILKYPQPGPMNSAMMNSMMNPGGGAGNLGGSSSLQYEPPWLRQQKQQQQMRLQQMMQQQHQSLGAKYYAGGLGSRDPVAMALQQRRAREIMLGERGRPRGRPPLNRAPVAPDVVNLADSD